MPSSPGFEAHVLAVALDVHGHDLGVGLARGDALAESTRIARASGALLSANDFAGTDRTGELALQAPRPGFDGVRRLRPSHEHDERPEHDRGEHQPR